MKIKIPKIVVGSDLTGMIIAAQNAAVFVPVAYYSPFSWEYSDQSFDYISWKRNFLILPVEKYGKDEESNQLYYRFKTKDGEFFPKSYLYEIEEMFKLYLTLNSQIWDDYSLEYCIHKENCVKFFGRSDDLVIEYEEMIVINPNFAFFRSDVLEKTSSSYSEYAHLLYHVRLNTEAVSDMKGINVSYDLEDLEGQVFTKVWYNKLFGQKELFLGFDPKRKIRTYTTKNLVFFIENVLTRVKENEEYDPSSIRREIQKFLSERSRRVKKKPFIFDKYVKKITLGSELDFYENSEREKFIYFEDKSEIICQKTLDMDTWQESFLPFLFKNTNFAIDFLLTNRLRLKLRR